MHKYEVAYLLVCIRETSEWPAAKRKLKCAIEEMGIEEISNFLQWWIASHTVFNVFIRTSNNQRLVSVFDFNETLKSNGITSIHTGPPRKTHGTDFVTTCDQGYLCHIASPSIHPRWCPNPEIEWHHVDTRGTSSENPREWFRKTTWLVCVLLRRMQ